MGCRVDVVGRKLMHGVAPASEEDAGMASVEEGRTEIMLRGAVSDDAASPVAILTASEWIVGVMRV